MSAGDTELVYTAREVGLGFGTFPSLELVHIIPSRRLTEDYLVQLSEGIAASNVLVGHLFDRPIEQTANWKIALRYAFIATTKGRRAARFYLARKRGIRAGKEIASRLQMFPLGSDIAHEQNRSLNLRQA
jgi:hypothetical protein